MIDHRCDVEGEEEKEQEEVFMVPIAEAIINKGTMMVKSLNTFVTVIAVHSVLRSQILAVDTDVV